MVREKVAEALPELLARFPTHKSYSLASSHREVAREARVNSLASMVFLNRSNRFEAQPLPAEAQLAPAFSVNIADFDGDGDEDGSD